MANYFVKEDKTFNEISNVKATSSQFGVTKLTTSTSEPSGDMPGVALAGTMGYTLMNAINTLETETDAAVEDLELNIETLKIPKSGGVGFSVSAISGAAYADQVGYGTWSLLGTLTVGSSTIYAYSRIT